MKRKLVVNLTTHYILSIVSEEDIFKRYICEVRYDRLVRNPMRKDNHPTAGFYINPKGRLIFHDFNGYFHGDCFAAVQKQLGISFIEAVHMIAKDFNIVDGTHDIKRVKRVQNKVERIRRIDIKVQKWTATDIKYWKSFHLNSNILDKYNISSISHLWLDGKLIYSYRDSDPAYAYYFGDGFYKIYFPLRDEYRFLTNAPAYIIQGYKQLPEEGELLIITKSLKDILVYDLLNIPSIAPQAENNFLSDELIKELKERFTTIVSNYDFDYAGVKSANRLRKQQDIKPYFLTNGRFKTKDFEAKDVAEYIQKYGKDNLDKYLKELWQQAIK